MEIADKEGITAVIQPGGSVKDDLSFAYCNEHGMAMVTTEMCIRDRHNNACGLASRPTVLEAWKDALAGDPVSAFGGDVYKRQLLHHSGRNRMI